MPQAERSVRRMPPGRANRGHRAPGRTCGTVRCRRGLCRPDPANFSTRRKGGGPRRATGVAAVGHRPRSDRWRRSGAANDPTAPTPVALRGPPFFLRVGIVAMPQAERSVRRMPPGRANRGPPPFLRAGIVPMPQAERSVRRMPPGRANRFHRAPGRTCGPSRSGCHGIYHHPGKPPAESKSPPDRPTAVWRRAAPPPEMRKVEPSGMGPGRSRFRAPASQVGPAGRT